MDTYFGPISNALEWICFVSTGLASFPWNLAWRLAIMGIQVIIGGLLIDPLCNVGTNILVIKMIINLIRTFCRFLNIVSRANFVPEYVFILLSAASGVYWEYFVRLIVTGTCTCLIALWFDRFKALFTGFMVSQLIQKRDATQGSWKPLKITIFGSDWISSVYIVSK